MERGTSLMSVMVAVALSGIVAVAVVRLITNQAKTMKLIELREERSRLLRHYRDAVNAGLLQTLIGRCGSGNFCGADGRVLIDKKGLYLSDNLYDYGNTDSKNKWWKINAAYAPKNKYAGQLAIELTVEFLSQQHPTIKTQLKPQTEVILLPFTP